MYNLLATLAIALNFLASVASAAPAPRTAAQWATLCATAHKPETLGTITLVRTQTRALATSLKAAGYPAGWHQDLAGVLLDHGDGTCGYDNRAALQLSPKDPEGDLDGNGIIDIDDPFPDGALFTDPSIKVPNGYVWSAKFTSAGAHLYLPPIAETPTRITAERDRLGTLAQKLCIESGRGWNAVAKTCPDQVPPRIPAVHTMPPPHQSVVTGTVSATPIALIAVALLGWLLFILMFYLWWNADHSERDHALLRANAAEELCIERTRQRDVAQINADIATADAFAELQAHDLAMDAVLAQALADVTTRDAEITRLREAAQASITAHTAAMTEVASARDEARATITVLTNELTSMRAALRTANDELAATKASLELESEEARAALAESDELLANAEDHIRGIEEAATTLRRQRAEAKVDTERTLEIAREQQRVLLMISRGGNAQLARVLPLVDAGLLGILYFLRVKCPRPGRGNRAGKTPRDKAQAQLTTLVTTLRSMFPAHPTNGQRHAALPAQAQTSA